MPENGGYPLHLRRVSFLYWSSVGINFRNDRSDNRTLKKLQIIFIPINHVGIFVYICV